MSKNRKAAAAAQPDQAQGPTRVIQLVTSARIARELHRPGTQFTELPDGISDDLLAAGAAVVAYVEAAQPADGDEADETNPSDGAEGETA